MAILDKTTLKTHFETGDIPSGSQFADLIDSYSDRSLTSLVSANSGSWLTDASILSDVAAASGNWDNTFTFIQSNSAGWGGGNLGSFSADGDYGAAQGDMLVGVSNRYGVVSLGTAITASHGVGNLVNGFNVTSFNNAENPAVPIWGLIHCGEHVTSYNNNASFESKALFFLGQNVTTDELNKDGVFFVGRDIYDQYRGQGFFVGEHYRKPTNAGFPGTFSAGVSCFSEDRGSVAIGLRATSTQSYGNVAIGRDATCEGANGTFFIGDNVVDGGVSGELLIGQQSQHQANRGGLGIGQRVYPKGTYGTFVIGVDNSSGSSSSSDVYGTFAVGRDATGYFSAFVVGLSAQLTEQFGFCIGKNVTGPNADYSGLVGANIIGGDSEGLFLGVNLASHTSFSNAGKIVMGLNSSAAGGAGSIIIGNYVSTDDITGQGVICLGELLTTYQTGEIGCIAIGHNNTLGAGRGSLSLGKDCTAYDGAGFNSVFTIGTGCTTDNIVEAGIAFGSGATAAGASNIEKVLQFGSGYNTVENSLQINNLIRIANQAPTSPKNGDIWLENNNVYIRTSDTTINCSNISS